MQMPLIEMGKIKKNTFRLCILSRFRHVRFEMPNKFSRKDAEWEVGKRSPEFKGDFEARGINWGAASIKMDKILGSWDQIR